MDANLVEKIKKNIQKSGFPTELYVLDVCSTKNTGRMPNIRYVYQGEEREIDLLAFFEEINPNPRGNANPQYTTTNMVVECKKAESKPWVFFSTSSFQRSGSLVHRTCYVSDFDLFFVHKGKHSLLGQIFKYLKENHYADMKIPTCISYCEAFKNPSSPSEIYKAVDSVLSFTSCEVGRRLKECEEVGFRTNFYYPIVVLEGDMVEAKVDRGNLLVEERDHIQLRVTYDHNLFVVDVVRKDHFDDFFELIQKDHNEFVSSIGRINFPKSHRRALVERNKVKMREFKRRVPLDLYMGRREST